MICAVKIGTSILLIELFVWQLCGQFILAFAEHEWFRDCYQHFVLCWRLNNAQIQLIEPSSTNCVLEMLFSQHGALIYHSDVPERICCSFRLLVWRLCHSSILLQTPACAMCQGTVKESSHASDDGWNVVQCLWSPSTGLSLKYTTLD